MADSASTEASLNFSSYVANGDLLTVTSLILGSMSEGGYFTFVVSSEKRRFQVHSDLISKHSKPLSAMINNKSMQESIYRTVTLDDIEPATFVRFAEFIYCGRYNISAPNAYSEKSEQTFAQSCKEIEQMQMAKCPSGFAFCCRLCPMFSHNTGVGSFYPYCDAFCINMNNESSPKCTNCKKKIAIDQVICVACERERSSFTPAQLTVRGWARFKKQFDVSGVECEYPTSRHHHPDDLSAHAKIWVFADRYQIRALEQLSLHKLHRELLSYNLKPESVKEIVELIQYVYEHTFVPDPWMNADGKIVGKKCELRDIVINYAACRADALVETRAFCIMLQGGGDAASDFAKAFTKRVD